MNKLLTSLIFVSVISFVSGCASLADSFDAAGGVGQLEVNYNLDDTRHIQVTPAWLNNHSSMNNAFKLGASWDEKSPDEVFLLLSYKTSTNTGGRYFTEFSRIEILVGDKLHEFDTQGLGRYDHSDYNTVSKQIYTESQSGTFISRELFDQMLSAEKCKIRIYTDMGYEDSDFTLERSSAGQGLAKLAFKKLKEAIDQNAAI